MAATLLPDLPLPKEMRVMFKTCHFSNYILNIDGYLYREGKKETEIGTLQRLPICSPYRKPTAIAYVFVARTEVVDCMPRV